MPKSAAIPPDSVRIRAARPEDATAMSELLNAIIEAGSYTILQGPIAPSVQLEFIESIAERGVFHVAEGEDGRMLGFQDVSPPPAWAVALRHVGEIGTFIGMGAQGRGVGSLLMRATLEAARAKGFEKLTAMIRADNPRAVGFYLSHGFRPVGTLHRHAFVDGGYVDEVLTERFLV